MDPVTWHNWSYRAIFVATALLLMAHRLLPLGTDIFALPAPDLILAMTFAWLLRQPAVVPIGIIVVVFLLADFLLQRPPGLYTVLVLLVTEWMRNRRGSVTEVNFLVEWSSVTGAIFAVLVLERLVLWVLVAQQTTLGLTLMHGLVTAAVYPLVVAITYFIFGLRKLGPAEPDTP